MPFDAPERFYDVYKDREIPEQLLPYYAEIARFDETVGQLLDYLETKRLLQKTLIVFVSDNGFRAHETKPETYASRSKLSEYEDGLRSPILIRCDGRVKPAEHSPLVHTVDVVPTILSALGLGTERTSRMQGVDLLPSATGRTPLGERPVFGAIYPNDAQALSAPARHVRGRWVREGSFKLVVPGPAKRPVPLSLFDLRSDPGETTNLADRPESAVRLEHLHRLLDDWWPVGDDGPVTKPANQ